MQRSISVVLIAALDATIAFAQPPPGYYDAAEGLTGEPLKQALYTIIANQAVHTYAQLWTDFQSTDVRGDGKVWDIYSDIPGGTSPYSFTFVTNQCGTYNSEGDCYNREHAVPKFWWNAPDPTVTPMYTDLNHLYPTDGYVNNKRGDFPYGQVGSPDWTSQNGSKTGTSITPGYTNTVFEPIDDFKGDLARTYFYMMTRYLPNVPSWTSDMFASGDLSQWAEDMLVQWNDADTVSAKEIERNNAVYVRQGNRNPFIDRPEWVHSIWGATASVDEHPASMLHVWYDGRELHMTSIFSGQALITIFDALGRQVATSHIEGRSSELPFAAPEGVYTVVLSSRSGQASARFVR